MKKKLVTMLGNIRQKHLKEILPGVAIGLALSVVVLDASAQATTAMSFPIIDNIMCSFFSYMRSKLAPLVGAMVVVFAMVGHWLGTGKVWGTLMYVGMGLGLVGAIGGLIIRYSGVGPTCLN